jgi:hypothetical protein
MWEDAEEQDGLDEDAGLCADALVRGSVGLHGRCAVEKMLQKSVLGTRLLCLPVRRWVRDYLFRSDVGRTGGDKQGWDRRWLGVALVPPRVTHGRGCCGSPFWLIDDRLLHKDRHPLQRPHGLASHDGDSDISPHMKCRERVGGSRAGASAPQNQSDRR